MVHENNDFKKCQLSSISAYAVLQEWWTNYDYPIKTICHYKPVLQAIVNNFQTLMKEN